MEQEEEHVVLSGREARQGRPGRPVLMVLVISLVLVCVALGVAWLVYRK